MRLVRTVSAAIVVASAFGLFGCGAPSNMPRQSVPSSPTETPSVSTVPAAVVPNTQMHSSPTPSPVVPVNRPQAAYLQGVNITISAWLLLVTDLADFVGKVDNEQIDDEQAYLQLEQFLARAQQTVHLADELMSMPAASAEFSGFKDVADKTYLAIQAYMDALEDEDEEKEDDARDLLEEVFDYAAAILDEIQE